MSVKSPNSNTKKQLTIQNWLVDSFAQQLSLNRDRIKVDEPLTRYGLDSIDAVTMVGDLEDLLDRELPSTLFWDYPTVEQAARYLEQLDLQEIAFVDG